MILSHDGAKGQCKGQKVKGHMNEDRTIKEEGEEEGGRESELIWDLLSARIFPGKGRNL